MGSRYIAEIDYPHTWYNIREGKSQYHGDVVVPVLRTVTVKGEHGKNFEDHIM